jgi:hypothetical protein
MPESPVPSGEGEAILTVPTHSIQNDPGPARQLAKLSVVALVVLVLLAIVTSVHPPRLFAAADTTRVPDMDSGRPIYDLPESLSHGTGPWPPRPLVNWAFGAGESLTYTIGWEKLTAGSGTMMVGEPVDTFGRLCYPIVSLVHSSSFVSTFYRVDDRVQTMLDAREIFPLRFEKQLSEGGYHSNREVKFDPVRGLGVTQADTFPVPPYVQDDLSLLYHVRTMELVPGKDVTVEIYSGKKLYRLLVKIIKKERIQVKAGVFSTIVVEPLLQAAGLFKHEGKVTVWLTDDRLHLPVLMKSKVVVGSIVAELEDYRLGQMKRY